MPGEIDLDKLLLAMAPKLLAGDYVFSTIKDGRYGDFAAANPMACFLEEEGLTLVLLKENADEFDLPYDCVFKCISLGVHSSLEAVGLTAAVAGKLAAHHISANIVAAYYHDHVFIPSPLAGKALAVLKKSKGKT